MDGNGKFIHVELPGMAPRGTRTVIIENLGGDIHLTFLTSHYGVLSALPWEYISPSSEGLYPIERQIKLVGKEAVPACRITIVFLEMRVVTVLQGTIRKLEIVPFDRDLLGMPLAGAPHWMWIAEGDYDVINERIEDEARQVVHVG